ncbi:MAG: MerR family transcriptional regulator [Pseudomonas sp.]|jgi:DNA-binding transcriptional MerR regulator|nr:MerR family transcriptional regulator [Pseudomonas sp.]MDY0413485.1 MerR family transcriptional regulator [Pseudomonas sp.]NLO54569.1 MerR family transcriptional regulator [Gammaproteobacteria bacterium]
MSNAIDQNALYPIREVARLTGINPITLRAWERRYQLIEPVRTESGHRLYSQEHIDFLHETLRLMDEGVPISRIKAVISESPAQVMQSQPSTAWSDSDSGPLLEKIRLALSQLQVQVLERQLDRLFADYSLNVLRVLLAEIEQQLQQQAQHKVALAFWHNSVTRRLQVRLHALYSQTVLPSKRIVIYAAAQTPEYLTKLVALFCFEQGYQPLEFAQPIAFESLLQLAKPYAMRGVLFVDAQGTATAEWNTCVTQYASMRTWVLGSDTVAELQPPSVNCELRVAEQWFAPLNL